MTMSDRQKPLSSLELRSKAVPEGRLELSFGKVMVDEPGAGEVVVRVEAAPINPTDRGCSPSKAAASFVNPLTVLGMLETLRREGHKALGRQAGGRCSTARASRTGSNSKMH